MMDLLVETAIRVTVLAFGVALMLALLRIRSPRLVHRAWSAVVVVMLLLPAFVAWGPVFSMPLLPSLTASSPLDVAEGPAWRAESHDVRVAVTPPAASRRLLTWTAAAFTVYVAGVCVFLARFVVGVRRARAIRRAAVDAHGRLTYGGCVTPMTIGIITPVVILPPDWTQWNEAELAAVLAHEEEHVRRRDPLVATLALFNRAIFWFHPLAWWLQRTIARLAEHACDAVVIAGGHDRHVYSACLLQFARRAAHAGGRIAPIATAMPGAGLCERLVTLDRWHATPSRVRLACAVAAGLVLVVICASAKPAAAPEQNRPFPDPGPVWPVLTSEHFVVVHDNLPADRVRDAVRDLEAAYAHVSTALKYDMPRPVRVILVRQDRDIAGQARTSMNASTRGQRVVLSLESLDRSTGLVVHELTHVFAFDIVPETSRIAPVVIEGLAEHQRGAWAPDDLRLVRAAAGSGAIPPVTVLANTDRHWAHAVFDFVAAWQGAEGVRRLLFALRAHETLEHAVPMAFGMTFEQFEQEFRGYVTATFGRL
jgi:beta-lactamase regulating signal transducer with metallopeptidase domain